MSSMLFEGTDLEEVLAEAKLCLGADMQVEAANRVRRGGMLGFFATEWYEVWAKPPEVTADPILALLEREETDEEPFGEMVRNAIAAGRPTAMAGAAPPAAAEAPVLPTAETTGPSLFARTTENERPVEARYAETMDEFFGADPWAEPMLEEGLHPDLASVTATPLAADRRAATVPAIATAGTSTLTLEPATDTPLAGLATEATPAAVALEDAPRGTSVFETTPSTTSGLLWSMLERLERLPEAPAIPTGPAVVAFVGDAHAAYGAARRMGGDTGLWNGDIDILTRRTNLDDLPSWLLVNDFDDAAARAERWRQRGGIAPIVIDQSVDAGDRAWAIKALTAVGADHVRLVTEAWRLPAEVGELGSRIGGVDVVDLIDVDGAVEPLAMLDLEIPVGTIEGRTATPDLLAAVWLENRRRG